MTMCPCGCGETFHPLDTRGRPRKFATPGCSLRVNNYMKLGRGNPFAGHQHTAATRAVLSAKASVPKPYLRGERNGMAGRTGSSNPNWKGGTSPERQRIYAGARWRRLRRAIYERDLSCTRCGSADELHMHHIKAWATHPDLRFDPDNIVLLCKPCHNDAHRKEVSHQ